MALNGYTWQVLENHNCFLILVVQKSCCQIHSSPSPTRPRMYNVLISFEMKYTKGSLEFFFTVPVLGNRIFRIPLGIMTVFFHDNIKWILWTRCLLWSRSVLEKDLCTSCHKPFNGDAKMILDDMKINCHASCFKVSALFWSFLSEKVGAGSGHRNKSWSDFYMWGFI